MLIKCLILTLAFWKSTKIFPGSISMALLESTRTSEEGGQDSNISAVRVDADVIETQMSGPKYITTSISCQQNEAWQLSFGNTVDDMQ